ncbi:unnamed protein product [Closterium sp. Yama58-4]|nr:unnamed protein product [Closterium sp. Yama58-4]
MGGSWCTSRSQCMVRAQTSLGSTRPWPEPGSKSFFAKSKPRITRVRCVRAATAAVCVRAQMNEFGAGFAGILSRKGRENPTFNDWNAVLVVYCDGGLYAGARGAYTANLTSPFFLEGHASLASVIHDLRLRGLGSARNVLFSGCSAGAQAVAMTCDAMARALPSASVKCLMDAGFFLDTPDIQGRLTWRQSVERLFKFHRMGLGIPPACRQGAHSPALPPPLLDSPPLSTSTHALPSPPHPPNPTHAFSYPHSPLPPFPPSAHAQQPWKCLLPQYNLPFLRTPLMVVNSLQDEIAVKMTFAPPLFSPLSPPFPHTAHAQQPWKCLLPQYNLPFLRTPLMVVNSLQDEIAVKMTFAPPLINGTVRVQKCIDNSPLCPAPYRTAFHLYQSRLARTVLAIQRAKRRQGVWFESFLMNSTSHCSAVYGEWVGKVDVLGRQLPRVVEEWFFHGRGGGAGGTGGLAGSGGVKRGGNGTRAGGVGAGKSGGGRRGAGGAGAGAGGVGKGGAGAGQKGYKGGWRGKRPVPRPPKAPGVQAGSAGSVKLPSKRGADQMGAGGSQGGEKGAGGAAGKGQQQQGAGKNAVKRPGTGIGKGPGGGGGPGAGKAPRVGGGGAGKAPGGQRGALWPGVRGVRGKGRGGLARTSGEEEIRRRSHGGGGKSGRRKKGKGGRRGRKSGKRRGGKSGGKSGRKGGGKSAGRGVGSREGGRRSEVRNSGPETVIVTEE